MGGNRRRPIRGGRLPAGGTIAVPSPASPVLSERHVSGGKAWLEAEGYRARLTPHANEGESYLAGPAATRARDLEEAFADPDVDAVVCLCGGHTAAQVLPHLDYALIAANPKPFVGFSELTVLHAALNQHAGLVTLYGPMVAQLSVAPEFTRRAFLHALTDAGPLGVIDPRGPRATTIVPGVAEGELVGGTLSIVASLLGTPWEIDTRGRILLLEEVDEEPCRVDRYLTQLLVAGKLEQCAGIFLGQYVRCTPDPEHPLFQGPSLTVEEIFDYLVRPLGIPTLHGLPVGHVKRFATVPLGVRVRLDADRGRLEVLEPAVL